MRNIQNKQSESNEYVRTTTGFFSNSWRLNIALESYFDEHGTEDQRNEIDESCSADHVVELL